MPKPTKGARLGGSPTHERIILRNLATQLFEHGRITTTETRARRVQPGCCRSRFRCVMDACACFPGPNAWRAAGGTVPTGTDGTLRSTLTNTTLKERDHEEPLLRRDH